MAIDDVSRPDGQTVPRRAQPRWPRWPRWQGGWARTTVIAAVLAGYAWTAGTAAPFTPASFIGVLIPGLVIAAFAWLWPVERVPAPQQLDVAGASYWIIAVAALFEWEASAFADNSRPWHPSLTDLVNPLLAPHPVKSAAILVWMLVGWALVRR